MIGGEERRGVQVRRGGSLGHWPCKILQDLGFISTRKDREESVLVKRVL